MIPARLMQHTVDVVYRAPGSDRYGEGDLVEQSRATVPAWMQMTDRSERDNEESTVVDWLLILNPSYRSEGQPVAIVPPAREDQVVWNARTFEVEGGAMEYRTPPRGVDHYEVRLKEVAA